MTDSSSLAAAFRRRFTSSRELLFGSFLKTPAPQPVEILGSVGFDFVVIDEEHAPFDRRATEMALLAARASGVAAIVRVPAGAPERLLAPLDDGAAGVLAPHVTCAADAEALVAACRYAGRRGFSNSPRAGDYGARSMWEHVDAADREVTVIAMIEDPQAIDAIDEILAVEGLDGVFIGRGDLGVALQDRQPGAPRVAVATETVLAAARRASKPVCLLAAGPKEVQRFGRMGASAFVLASDQGFMRSAASAALAAHRQAVPLPG